MSPLLYHLSYTATAKSRPSLYITKPDPSTTWRLSRHNVIYDTHVLYAMNVVWFQFQSFVESDSRTYVRRCSCGNFCCVRGRDDGHYAHSDREAQAVVVGTFCPSSAIQDTNQLFLAFVPGMTGSLQEDSHGKADDVTRAIAF